MASGVWPFYGKSLDREGDVIRKISSELLLKRTRPGSTKRACSAECNPKLHHVRRINHRLASFVLARSKKTLCKNVARKARTAASVSAPTSHTMKGSDSTTKLWSGSSSPSASSHDLTTGHFPHQQKSSGMAMSTLNRQSSETGSTVHLLGATSDTPGPGGGGGGLKLTAGSSLTSADRSNHNGGVGYSSTSCTIPGFNGEPANIAASKSYKCSVINEAGFCFLENVVIDGVQSIQTLDLPRHPILLIKSGAIPNFSKEIYSHLPGVRLLHVYNNTVIRKLLIASSNLSEINVQRNGLLEFDVEPVENRDLKTLTVVHNAITTVPKNIRYLEGLEKLYLYNNSIEYVDLELFTNATQLKVLSLYDNRIKTLDSKQGLRFPSLQTLSLSKNKLVYIPYFFEAFPVLNAISLRKNPWNCQWLESAMAHINQKAIQIARKDATCRDRWVGDICCYKTVLDFLYYLRQEDARQDRNQLLQMAQQNQELKHLLERLSESVHKLEERGK
ncbi:hypothetical protein pipiens_015354 [Culex pipiens pipiens]|uniref:Leucine-rich repeat protein n=1 Tax=Culex pipiens pipiens TaxID=38569 RepID=A0ABD1CQS2_CULPP